MSWIGDGSACFVGIILAYAICWPIEYFVKRNLRSGDCECGHQRCNHFGGKRACAFLNCPCHIYVPATDKTDAEVKQLRKMAGIK